MALGSSSYRRISLGITEFSYEYPWRGQARLWIRSAEAWYLVKVRGIGSVLLGRA